MTTLTEFHLAIENAIDAHFGDNVNTIAWYQQGETPAGQPLPIITPAVILEIESAEEGDDIGDDRAPLLCHFTAYCILGQQTEALQIQVREFAAQLFKKVRKNKWGLAHNVSFPGMVTLGPGKFDPEKNGFDSWYVSWDQTLYLGDSIWDSTGIMPTEILWSELPLIGTGNEDHYEPMI
jgi:hypothetical protein